MPSENHPCQEHKSLVSLLENFDKKLDILTATVGDSHTKLTEFLAKHTEHEKRFIELLKQVNDHEKDLNELKISCAVLSRDIADTIKDLNNVSKQFKEAQAAANEAKELTWANKLLMYGGTSSGLLALCLLLIKYILK